MESLIQALGDSVDKNFISILQAGQNKPKPETRFQHPKKRSPRKLRGGKITWIEHVRLTAGEHDLSWKEAMKVASKTWH